MLIWYLIVFCLAGDLSKWRRASSRAPSTAWIAELDLKLRGQLLQARKNQEIPKLMAPRKRKRRTIEFPALPGDVENTVPEGPAQNERTELFSDE